MVVCGVQSNDEGLAGLTLLACGGAHAADVQLSIAVVADILVVDPDFDGSAVAKSLYYHTGMGLACASAPSNQDSRQKCGTISMVTSRAVPSGFTATASSCSVV